MARFFVDPEISRAKTISTQVYLDPVIYEESKEKIFARTWQYLADSSVVKDQGHCHPFTLLPGYINEPFVITKDSRNIVHCLSNVCTHRGNLIVESPCELMNLRCRYHGRLFQLDGKFKSMPEFSEVQDFPTKDDDLRSLNTMNWGNLLFGSLSNEMHHHLFFGDMMERLSWLPLETFKARYELSRTFTVKANWALYCENYLEGFHIPFVHAGLNTVIDFGKYTTELFRYSNVQVGIAKGDELCFDLPENSPEYGKRVAAYYFWVFPNMMFNFYPWGLSLNIIEPSAIDRTTVRFLTYVWKEDLLHQGAGSNLDIVELEDEDVVEAVQQGVRSRFYKHGRYSVSREQGTHHFHRILAEFLNEEPIISDRTS
jgi:choline monooxygenase